MMSLFDILKYGNTDLNNSEELSKLPLDLFTMYQEAAYNHFNNSDVLENARKDDIVSQYQYMSVGWHTDQKYLKSVIFNKVLNEYEPI